MFEKCGLRDIFCKIAAKKWLMIIIILIFTCIGAGLFLKDRNDYNEQMAAIEAGKPEAYTGTAFYYLIFDDHGSVNVKISQIANNYIGLMKIAPRAEKIYDELLTRHTEEELLELLGPDKFKKGLEAADLWENSYKVESSEGGYVLRLTTLAETKEMCEELMGLCRTEMEALSDGFEDSELTFEGVSFVSEAIAEGEEEMEEPGVKKILIWLVLGIVAALLYAIISAVLRPVINRPSDFEFYNVPSSGLTEKKNAGVLARVLEKKTGGTGGKIALATSLREDKTITEFTELLISEWKKINGSVGSGETGPVIEIAGNPCESAEASDCCSSADRVFTIERKGVTTHKNYDEMVHYLELIDRKPEEAIFIR